MELQIQIMVIFNQLMEDFMDYQLEVQLVSPLLDKKFSLFIIIEELSLQSTVKLTHAMNMLDKEEVNLICMEILSVNIVYIALKIIQLQMFTLHKSVGH